MKLTTKYYSHSKILEKIAPTAYKLHLPKTTHIHIVFYVSHLKRHICPKAIPQSNLPLVTRDGYIKIETVGVLNTRALPRRDDIITQWKIQWQNFNS
jgi:hypothetical protein